MSIMVYVMKQGRYMGYFQDVIGSYSYSTDYIFLSAPHTTTFTNSQYTKNLLSSLPSLIPSISPLSFFFGITSISIQQISTLYTYTLSTSTYAITTTNGLQNYVATYLPWIGGGNQMFVFGIGKVTCAGGGYYDKVGGMCYQGFSGGDKMCTGVSSQADLGITGIANVNINMQNIDSYVGIISSNTTYTQIRYLQYSNNTIHLSSSTTFAASTSPPIPLTPTLFILSSTLYSTHNSTSPTPISPIIPSPSNTCIITSLYSSIKDSTTSIYRNIQSSLLSLHNISIDLNVSNIGSIRYGVKEVDSLGVACSVDGEGMIWVGVGWLMESVYNSTTTQQYEYINLGSITNIAQDIISHIHSQTNNTNLTLQSLLPSSPPSSPTLTLTHLHSLSSLLTLSSTSPLSYQLTTTQTLQLQLYNYIYLLQIQLSVQLHQTQNASNVNVQNGSYVVEVGNNQSRIGCVVVGRVDGRVVGRDVVDLGVDVVGGLVDIVGVVVNKVSVDDIPNYIPINQYAYIQTYYSYTHYLQNRITLTYILSNSQVHSFISTHPSLHPSPSYTLPINSTINYTYIYTEPTQTSMSTLVSGSQLVEESNVYNDSSLYDGVYGSGGSGGWGYVRVGVEMVGVVGSVLASSLSYQGNPGIDNNTYTGNDTSTIIQLLLPPTSKPISSTTTTNSKHLYILTSLNLLYIFTLTQPASTPSPSSPPTYKLSRLIDIQPYLQDRASVPKQECVSIGVGEVGVGVGDTGVVYVGSNYGRVYGIECGWGVRDVKEEYRFRYVQLDIPVPPIPPTPNNTNSTNTTDYNTTNSTNTTDYNTSNNTTPTPPINPNTILTPQQQPTQLPQTQQLPQTAIEIIATVCSVFAVAAGIAIYFLFIKKTAEVRVNPQQATRTHLYSTKNVTQNATQINQKQKIGVEIEVEKSLGEAERTDTRIDRIKSGKTDAGSLMEFQMSSNNSIMEIKKNDLKGKKIKRVKPQYSAGSLQTLRSMESPYSSGDGRGLVQDKDRTIVFDIEE